MSFDLILILLNVTGRLVAVAVVAAVWVMCSHYSERAEANRARYAELAALIVLSHKAYPDAYARAELPAAPTPAVRQVARRLHNAAVYCGRHRNSADPFPSGEYEGLNLIEEQFDGEVVSS